MATCPICLERAAKRYCPAKETQICAMCCGTMREVEIDCPSDCKHLISGRSYEAEKVIPDPELITRVRQFDSDFLHRFSPIFDAVNRAVIEERIRSQWLVDHDVIEVYRALTATLKTLSNGIYYESLPEGPVRVSLFRRLRGLFDELMEPQVNSDRRRLRASEALQVLDFLTLAAQINSGIRPKSRRYLDWIMSMAAPIEQVQSSGLILP